MELKGTKTEKNLWEAFAGESQARNKYTYFASMAKKEGYEQLAAIFEETAGNEKEHAKIWFKLLCGGAIPDTLTCLDMAAGGHVQAGERVGDGTAAQQLEPDLGMLLLVAGGLLKDGSQLLIAFLLGHAGKVGVLVACLALACKGFPQVFLGLGTLEFHTLFSFCSSVSVSAAPLRGFRSLSLNRVYHKR